MFRVLNLIKCRLPASLHRTPVGGKRTATEGPPLFACPRQQHNNKQICFANNRKLFRRSYVLMGTVRYVFFSSSAPSTDLITSTSFSSESDCLHSHFANAKTLERFNYTKQVRGLLARQCPFVYLQRERRKKILC